jgi:4-diphosphocytidyl-2-C-methyl-D-erythritol kinase
MMLKLFSPAKINLFLRIVNKRPDGYHNLSSLFQAIDLGDSLTFQSHHKDQFTCSDPRLPLDENNLIIKALNLFREKAKIFVPIKIHLEKNIPTEAGLGGGSSNAATTLWALNQLTHYGASAQQLAEWSAEIGSDIPFFFSQGTAFCTGRGEIVRNLPFLKPTSAYIVKPDIGMPTQQVFKKLSLHVSRTPSNDEDLNSIFSGAIPHFNDLEKPAFELNPHLYYLKQRLLAGGFQTVLLSGSGSSFFCLGEGVIPADPDLFVSRIKFINRNLSTWYSPELQVINSFSLSENFPS